MELNAYWLAILTLDDQQLHRINLDEHGWMETYAGLLRRPAEWHLIRHSDQVVGLSMLVREGQQPFYFSRVFKNSGSDELAVRSWVLGTKTPGVFGEPDAEGKHEVITPEARSLVWILETGQVGAGEPDLDYFGFEAYKDKSADYLNTMREAETAPET